MICLNLQFKDSLLPLMNLSQENFGSPQPHRILKCTFAIYIRYGAIREYTETRVHAGVSGIQE